jgi:hypothetical protein
LGHTIYRKLEHQEPLTSANGSTLVVEVGGVWVEVGVAVGLTVGEGECTRDGVAVYTRVAATMDG